ncbi:MAG: FtsX-like permease family protein [Acholeplasmataceae bacterium]|nr:FtsX-like permease family protein [Acholeplasmataceae bacterium]
MIYNTIYDYAANNYHKAIQNGFIVPKENNDPISEYEKQMAYYQFLSVYEGSGFINNPYGINGIDLAIPKINEFFTTYQTIFNNQRNFTMYFYNNFNYEYQEFPIEIVGIYYPDKDMSHSEVWNNQTYYNPYYYTIIDDEFYQMISNMKIGDFEFAISSMPTSRDEIRKAVMFNYTRFDNTEYHINNQVSFLLEQANTIIETLAKVFLYIGIGFAVFASILMMNFIATSINQKKRDIGVLRALGSRSSDVFGIFYNESLIVTLFNFLLSTILTGVVVLLINSLLRKNFGLLITLLNFGVRQIVLMLLISVFVATVSSFIPTYRISRKKPIDAIRNR